MVGFNVEVLIGRIYEAAVLPELWPDVLSLMTEMNGSMGSVLALARAATLIRSAASSAEFAHVQTEYHQLFPVNRRMTSIMEVGRDSFVSDVDYVQPGETYFDDTYQEYLIPEGYGAGLATAIATPLGDDIVVHSEFAYTGGPLPESTIKKMNALRPHFARACLLSSRSDMQQAHSVAQMLGAMGAPVAILRAGGRVYAANALFEALMPALLHDRSIRVTVTDAAADRLLAKALLALDHSGAGSVRSIPVGAAEGRSPMVLHLIPICGAAHDIFAQARALLVVTPVDRAAVPTAEVMQGLFDLTPAEARVARGIAEALTIDDIARAQGKSRETIRSQLKAVLSKTGLARQQQLVRLLAGISLSM